MLVNGISAVVEQLFLTNKLLNLPTEIEYWNGGGEQPKRMTLFVYTFQLMQKVMRQQ